MTTKTSRRSLLAGMAGAVMLSPAIAAETTAPDAELIALGKQLSEFHIQHAKACARLRPLWDKHKKLLNEWLASNPNAKHGEATAQYHRISDEIGLTAASDEGHPDDVTAAFAPVLEAILAIPATTIAGLAVKARLAKFEASQLYAEPDADADWDDRVLRNVIDAVLEVAALGGSNGAK